MKKLTIILTAILFVFALTLSSCGQEADTKDKSTTEKDDNKGADDNEKVNELKKEIEDLHDRIDELDKEDGKQWDELLDGYEDYVDKTIFIMKKMKDDPTDVSVMQDYNDLMISSMEWTEKITNATTADGFGPDHLQRMMSIIEKLNDVAY